MHAALRTLVVALTLCSSGAAAQDATRANPDALAVLLAGGATRPARCDAEHAARELATSREAVHTDWVAGELWVRGANYKLHAARNVRFLPFFSSSAPRHYPLEFELLALRCGEREQTFERNSTPRLDGAFLSYERGPLTELYELAPRSVEQSFVLHAPLARGELVLELALRTELAPQADGAGWKFTNEFGELRYGAAVALDADGRRLELASTLVDGRLALRVPAEFAESARYPLVIDPVIAAFGIEATPAESFSPDVCFDATGASVLHVWESEFNANDHDVWGDMYTPAGVPLYRGGWIDSTVDYWARPRAANRGASNRFLVVAHVLNAATNRIEIWGRTRDTNTALLSPPFKIAGGTNFDLLNPDVGGDPYPSGTSYFLVAYERIYTFGQDHDLHGKLVTDAGTLVNGTVNIDLSMFTYDSRVSVSRSNNSERWNLAWQRASPAGGNDIFGARVAWNGVVSSPSFPIAATLVDHKSPAASSSQQGSQRWLVAYEEDFGSDHDIVVSGLDGATVRATLNMSSYDGAFWYQDQRAPALDGDGSRYVCAYSELYGQSTNDYDVYATELLFNGNSLVALAAHQPVSAGWGIEIDARVAAHESSQPAASSRAFAIALAREPDGQAFVSFDILAAQYESGSGGAVASFCDGATVVCPCGNGASTVGGCPNSANSAGAHLSWGGSSSTSQDTLQLFVSGLPPNTTCLFFQGPSALNGATGAVFGDGVRCVAAPIQRLGLKTASGAGGALFPGPGDPSLSLTGAIPAAGATVVYQVWYRNPGAFCSGATTNYSNALVAAWAP